MARPAILALLVALLLALPVTACDAGTKLPVERTWDLVVPGPQGARPLPVRVVDETGTVKLAELAGDRVAAFNGFGGAESVDGDRTRLLVSWTGGSCDRSAEVRYTRDGAGWRATVTTEQDAGACDAMGIGRSVIVDLANGLQVDPATVTVTSG